MECCHNYFSKDSQSKKEKYKLDLFQVENLDTEEVNLMEDSCVPIDCMGCRIKLTDPLESGDGLVYRYLTTPDGSTPFKIVSPRIFQLKLNNTKGKTKYAFYENGYIYLSKCYPCIKIAYLSSSGKDGETCSILDNEINISDEILADVIALSYQEFNIYLQRPIDRVANKSEA